LVFLLIFCQDVMRVFSSRLNGLLRHVLAHRPHDDTARILGQHLLHLLAQALALGTLADLSAHADARGEGHVDEEPARHRDLRGHARALRGDRLLGHLHDERLPALEHVLDLRRVLPAPAPTATRLPRRLLGLRLTRGGRLGVVRLAALVLVVALLVVVLIAVLVVDEVGVVEEGALLGPDVHEGRLESGSTASTFPR
jgi:hypothetical protein